MSCCAGRNGVKQVAGNNKICVSTTDPTDAMRWDDAAGTHGAPGTGEPGFAIPARRLLHLETVPDGFDAFPHCHFKHWFCVLIDRPGLCLLLDEDRVQEGHTGTVKFADLQPFLDNDGFWFIRHEVSSHR